MAGPPTFLDLHVPGALHALLQFASHSFCSGIRADNISSRVYRDPHTLIHTSPSLNLTLQCLQLRFYLHVCYCSPTNDILC